MEVCSEIIPFFETTDTSDKDKKRVISKIKIIKDWNSSLPGKDEDDDYILQRRENCRTIDLEHYTSTELGKVGLQVWRGALFLSDFIIHSREQLQNSTVLELGAGVGLSSMIAAMFARHVISTDIPSGGILDLMQDNFTRNKPMLRGKISIFPLDWFSLDYDDKLEAELKDVSIILAADVIYDDRVTEAFVRTAKKLLSRRKGITLYVALEKRYVFTMADLDSVAPCYEHFLRCLRQEQRSEPWSKWTTQLLEHDFPQYLDYERIPQLVLWKISS